MTLLNSFYENCPQTRDRTEEKTAKDQGLEAVVEAQWVKLPVGMPAFHIIYNHIGVLTTLLPTHLPVNVPEKAADDIAL